MRGDRGNGEAGAAEAGRSDYWEEVVRLVERSRTRHRRFDPESDPPRRCLEAGVEPIVRLYVGARREGCRLSQVERSLLDGSLEDWLAAYASARDAHFTGGYSVHELAVEACRDDRELAAVVDDLLGLSSP